MSKTVWLGAVALVAITALVASASRVARGAVGPPSPTDQLPLGPSSRHDGPPTHSTQLPVPAGNETFEQATSAPHAGQIFIAEVTTRDETARETYVSLKVHCAGAIVSKRGKLLHRVAAHRATFPEGSDIPLIEVLSFKIPRRYGRHPSKSTIDKYFGYSCSVASDRITPDGGHIFTQGKLVWPPPPMWPIPD